MLYKKRIYSELFLNTGKYNDVEKKNKFRTY